MLLQHFTQAYIQCYFVKSLEFVYTKLFSKEYKNLIKSPEGLKVMSFEVFWKMILNQQYDLHTIYQIVARNCHGGCIYSALGGERERECVILHKTHK